MFVPTLNDAALGLCALVGSLLLYSGVKGTFLAPLEFLQQAYGMPHATRETALVFPAATARNLGAGCFVWAMVLANQRATLGAFLTCWAWAGVADTLILLRGPGRGEWSHHARNTGVLLVLGPYLALSSA